MLGGQLAIIEFFDLTDVGEVRTGGFNLDHGAFDAAVAVVLGGEGDQARSGCGRGGEGQDCKQQGGSDDGLEAHSFVMGDGGRKERKMFVE
jgi:hypothetical protein